MSTTSIDPEIARQFIKALAPRAAAYAARIKAKSLAPCTIYFVQSGPDGFIKIGACRTPVASRVAALQTGSPYAIKLLGVIAGVARSYEYVLHQCFEAERLHGEWFMPTPELLAFIAKEAVQL